MSRRGNEARRARAAERRWSLMWFFSLKSAAVRKLTGKRSTSQDLFHIYCVSAGTFFSSSLFQSNKATWSLLRSERQRRPKAKRTSRGVTAGGLAKNQISRRLRPLSGRSSHWFFLNFIGEKNDFFFFFTWLVFGTSGRKDGMNSKITILTFDLPQIEWMLLIVFFWFFFYLGSIV